MSTTPATPDTILLIHGFWMTPRSWEHWKERYESRGYTVLAPAWPGMEVEVEALNADPDQIAGLDIEQIVDHYDKIIRNLDRPPVIMGHSFGGAFTQILLDRGLGVVGVGVSSATVKGILDLPWSTIKSSAPALLKSKGKAVGLTPKEFHYAFANTLSEEESNAIHERYAVPGPTTVLARGRVRELPPEPTDEGRLRPRGSSADASDRLRRGSRYPGEGEPASRGEVRRRGDDHRVQVLRGPSALPGSAWVGGGRGLRARMGDGAREQDGRRARRRRHRVALSPRGRAPEAPIRSVAWPRRARWAGRHPSGRRVRSP